MAGGGDGDGDDGGDDDDEDDGVEERMLAGQDGRRKTSGLCRASWAW